jgi:hypothetical protein
MLASMTRQRGAEMRLMPIADGEDTDTGSYGNGGMFVYLPRGVCRALLVSFLEDKDMSSQERDIKKADYCVSMVLRPQDEGLVSMYIDI